MYSLNFIVGILALIVGAITMALSFTGRGRRNAFSGIGLLCLGAALIVGEMDGFATAKRVLLICAAVALVYSAYVKMRGGARPPA
jgi:hypothetical protein